MTRINNLNARLGSIVDLQCRLRLIFDPASTSDNDSSCRLMIEDATGELVVYLSDDAELLADFVDAAETLAPLQVQIYVRMFDGCLLGDLRAIKSLDFDEVINAAAIIPRMDCPALARKSLRALVGFNEQLRPLALREFLNHVLMHEAFIAALQSLDSGNHYEFCDSPSLLVRAMTAVELTAELCRKRLNPTEAAVAQLAAFLHAFGVAHTGDSHSPALNAWAKEFFHIQLTLLTFISPEVGQRLKQTLEHVSEIDPGDYCSGIGPIDFVHFSRLPVSA